MNAISTTTRIFCVAVFLSCAAASASGKPQQALLRRAFVTTISSPYDGFIRQTGNVNVVFADGHTETWTHEGDCTQARVSVKGAVGWIQIDKAHVDTGRMIVIGKDCLVVRSASGVLNKFPPYQRLPDEQNWYIEGWRFADKGTAVIVRSMGHHGPSSFVKYDIASGRVVDARGARFTPYAELPKWAKPLANPDVD